MANVIYGRLGKSIRFNRKDIATSAATGAGEARTLIITLAKYNPQNTYYLVGRNDLSKLEQEEIDKLFPNKNVVDIWSDFKDYKDKIKIEDFVIMKMKDIKIDYGVMFGGVLNLSLPNAIKQKKNPEKFAKPMDCFYYYGSPVIKYLNESKIPWICCNTDTRYYPVNSDDLLNPEKIIVGMWDSEFKVERLRSFDSDEKIEYNIKSLYSRIETLFLADDEKLEIDEELMSNKKGLIIFHNQDGKLNKKKIIQEYIFDKGLEVEIYGKWKDVEDDERFKGFLKFNELHKKLQSAKYTFLIPINKTPLCSMKFYESINYGVIPFIYKDYDMDKKLEQLGMPSFCRIEDEDDLKRKIDILENDNDKYEQILEQLYDMLTPELFNGTHINNEINRALKIANIVK